MPPWERKRANPNPRGLLRSSRGIELRFQLVGVALEHRGGIGAVVLDGSAQVAAPHHDVADAPAPVAAQFARADEGLQCSLFAGGVHEHEPVALPAHGIVRTALQPARIGLGGARRVFALQEPRQPEPGLAVRRRQFYRPLGPGYVIRQEGFHHDGAGGVTAQERLPFGVASAGISLMMRNQPAPPVCRTGWIFLQERLGAREGGGVAGQAAQEEQAGGVAGDRAGDGVAGEHAGGREQGDGDDCEDGTLHFLMLSAGR